MKIPEPLFVFINPMMRMLLGSPLHFLMSKGVMLIKYQGRRSGKRYSIPVRYVEEENLVKCFTARENGWWPNLKDGAAVTLRIRGVDRSYRTSVLEDEATKRLELERYLDRYPSDAVYHNIRLNRDKTLNVEDLERHLPSLIVIVATPLSDHSATS